MKVETFRGKTMAEALAKVKHRFGADAVILNTRADAARGLFGVTGRPFVEITATREIADLQSPPRRDRVRDNGSAATDGIKIMPTPMGKADGAATPMRPVEQNSSTGFSPHALASELGSLRSLVTDLVRETRRLRAPNLHGELFETYQSLIANDVAEKIASSLVEQIRAELTFEQLHDRAQVRAKLSGLVQAMLPTSGPIRIRPKRGAVVIAMIGPTGVGKTTTIAKLAANFRLRGGRKVGLITLDTYRIAAVEQLKTYANIIDVPLEVANSPRQLQDAVGRMTDCDVVLVDTAGRSQRDSAKLTELQQFFAAVVPDEMHLVLSGAAGEAVLIDSIERFGVFPIDSLIFTKLDEAIGFGVMLSCLQKAKSRLSYVTTGQDVPDDIRVGESKALAGLILRGGSIGVKNLPVAS